MSSCWMFIISNSLINPIHFSACEALPQPEGHQNRAETRAQIQVPQRIVVISGDGATIRIPR